MNINKINASTTKDHIQFNYAVNEHTTTWQVSYVWLTGLNKGMFKCMEEFFFYSISNCPYETFGSDWVKWIDRYKHDIWVNGLKIIVATEEQVQKEICEARKEILENEQEEGFCLNNFYIAGSILNAYLVEETLEPRHRVGATWGYVFETDSAFFYLERHWES